jgi:phosphate transport system substrate-binding protein
MKLKSTSSFIAGLVLAITCNLLFNGCGESGHKGNSNDTASSGTDNDDNTLLGAGSTFVYPLFSKMFAEYGQNHPIKVNYQSIGSGGGILQLTNKTVDFGGSDAPLNDEQTQKIGVSVLHVPMASGADVVSYNLPSITQSLKMTPELIAGIFLGKINNWNDPKIAGANPGIKFPNQQMVVIHRSDGSGTTYIWTDYLSKISPEWAKRVGKATSVNWPTGLGGKGNEGVAGLVRQTPGAIGYIELSYAIQNKMPVAQVENKTGKFITPDLTSITAASDINLPADAKVSLTDTGNPDGYPISSFTWALIYKEQNYNGRSAAKTKELLDLLWWNIHDGQKNCESLNYATLSKSAVAVAENILKSATYNGQPILK